jgi:hypothetical protein
MAMNETRKPGQRSLTSAASFLAFLANGWRWPTVTGRMLVLVVSFLFLFSVFSSICAIEHRRGFVDTVVQDEEKVSPNGKKNHAVQWNEAKTGIATAQACCFLLEPPGTSSSPSRQQYFFSCSYVLASLNSVPFPHGVTVAGITTL